MADQQSQFQGKMSNEVSDQALRDYLLCALDEPERLQLDEHLLADDDLAQRARLAESELIDDYVAGQLNAVEQKQFDESFLSTQERRRKLQFVSTLQSYAASREPEAASPLALHNTAPTWRESLAGLFRFERPAWAIAGSLAVLVLLVGLAWFALRPDRRPEPLTAKEEALPSTSPQTFASPKPETTIPPAPVTPPTIASFVLLPSATRSGGEMTRVSVPDGERDKVRLTLVLETAGDGVYQAKISTAEGQAVTSRGNLKSSKGKVVIEVPARLLLNHDYQVTLSRGTADGATETVGDYFFRAQKH